MDTAGPAGMMGVRQETNQVQTWQPLAVTVCSLAIIAAMVLGVGIGSHLVLRHVVQTLPLWVAVAFGLRRSRATGWVALPSFLGWFILMALIWLYLLGLSTMMSGHFSPLEIAMTVVVGIASTAGTVAFIRLKSGLSGWSRTCIFISFAVIQLACLRLSFLPAIAHR